MGYKLANGYIQLNTVIHRKKYEHRVVWEEHNGPIPKGYDIHHINGIKDDNHIENLELIKRSKHTRMHHTITKFKKRFLISQIRKGRTIVELSKQLNICRNTIYRILKNIGAREILCSQK